MASARSGGGGPTGRVLVDGGDRGAGFALGPRLVVTANHVVRERGDRRTTFVGVRGTEIDVGAVKGDDTLDVAVLSLESDVEVTLPVGRAAERAPWRVETRPKESDPALTGTITDTARPVVNAQGEEAELLQLQVDQVLGDYGGYSGSPVVLESPRDAVIGVLVEQQRWRHGALPGQPVPAANVLYATPIEQVVARFAVEDTVQVAPPHRFDVPRPQTGLVERANLLTRLLDVLDQSGVAVILVRGMPGMGKSVLVRQAAHHSRTWTRYTGGVMEHVVGQDTDADELLNGLRGRLGTGPASLAEAFSDGPALLILDDVWSDEVISTPRGNLPDQVTLLATTRGVGIKGAAVVRVDELTPAEAIELLARLTPRDSSLDASLAHMAEVIGRWPLLVDMAARHLHRDDLLAGEVIDADEAALSPPPQPADLARRAEELAKEFEDDPTLLDDPDSRQRSFDRMLRRSLDRLSTQAAESFAQLAVYPADADLTETLLGDLWQLDPVRTEKTISALARVGLATLTSGAPPTLRLHDLVVAWLHHQYGGPDAPSNSHLHRRCVERAITSEGTPAGLTPDRSTWLAFHLCRTDTLADASALLDISWRSAYRTTAGSDALYLAALREIASHYAARLDNFPTLDGATKAQVTAWILKAALLHAELSTLIGAVPSSILATQALLGRPEAAADQAASNPDGSWADEGLSEIVRALNELGGLTPGALDYIAGVARRVQASRTLTEIAVILAPAEPDRALGLAEQIPSEGLRSLALTAIAEARASTHPDRAQRLLDRALSLAEQIPDERLGVTVLGRIAQQVAPRDLDRAQRVLERAVSLAEQITDEWERSEVLREIAQALVPIDPDRAQRLLDHALSLAEQIPSEGLRRLALTRIAKALAPTDPDRALSLAEQIPDEERISALIEIAEALAPTDPDRALSLAEQIPDEERRNSALDVIARALATTDPDRALSLAEQIPSDEYVVSPLVVIAEALAPTDPDRALSLSEQISGEWDRSRALEKIAQALTPTDLERTERQLERALSLAEQITDEGARGWALGGIARALARRDPDGAQQLLDRALSLSEQIPDFAGDRSTALAELARALASTDPDRALSLAEQITDEGKGNWALREIAQALAPKDPDRAERILDVALGLAEQIPDGWLDMGRWERTRALAEIAQALAPTNPDRALSLAEQITDEGERNRALAHIAQALAPTDPNRAERVLDRVISWAEQITDEGERLRALADIAPVLAPTDPDRALSLAEQIPEGWERNRVLARIAEALAPTDPNRAESVLDGTSSFAERIPDEGERNRALAHIAQALAPTDPDRALSLTEQIPDKRDRGIALDAIAWALAHTDPDRAVSLAEQITDEQARSTALGHIAGTRGTGRPLLLGVRQSWSRDALSLRFFAAFLASHELPEEYLRVIVTEVLEVPGRFTSVQKSPIQPSALSRALDQEIDAREAERPPEW